MQDSVQIIEPAFLRGGINFAQSQLCTVEVITAGILRGFEVCVVNIMRTLTQSLQVSAVRILTDRVVHASATTLKIVNYGFAGCPQSEQSQVALVLSYGGSDADSDDQRIVGSGWSFKERPARS